MKSVLEFWLTSHWHLTFLKVFWCKSCRSFSNSFSLLNIFFSKCSDNFASIEILYSEFISSVLALIVVLYLFFSGSWNPRVPAQRVWGERGQVWGHHHEQDNQRGKWFLCGCIYAWWYGSPNYGLHQKCSWIPQGIYYFCFNKTLTMLN